MFRLTQTSDLSVWQGDHGDAGWRDFLGDVRRLVGKDASELADSPAPSPAPAGSGVPIVAVLPITHRGESADLEFLAEDLTEEITREMARNGYFEVIATSTMAAWRGRAADNRAIRRELGARYLVEGKIQRSGETARLTMQVIDSATSKMVWSQRFVRRAEEIDGSPEELAVAVCTEAGEQIFQTETIRAMAKPGPWSGWEHVARAWVFNGRSGSESSRRGVDESRQAVAIAPDFGLAHASLAVSLASLVTVAGEQINEARSREIRTHATRALQLDAENPRVIGNLVNAYAVLDDGESALRLARRAVELEPNSPVPYLWLGFAHMVVGSTSDAIAAYEREISIASHDTQQYAALGNLGRCYLLEGKLAEGETALDRSLGAYPDYDVNLKWKSIAAALRGKEETALANVKRLREVEPDKSIDQHVRQMMFYKGLADRLTEPVAILRRLWAETEPAG